MLSSYCVDILYGSIRSVAIAAISYLDPKAVAHSLLKENADRTIPRVCGNYGSRSMSTNFLSMYVHRYINIYVYTIW